MWKSGPRYAAILESSGLGFRAPLNSEFIILDRLEGNLTTDFGAPDAMFPNDWDPLFTQDIDRFKTLMVACWRAFDRAAAAAGGKDLQKGPRGGGRELEKIVSHVVDAEEGYLRVLGIKPERIKNETIEEKLIRLREEAVIGLEIATGGQLSREGPRGGKRWPPRFYVRRVAWHAVDHAWEIEDRIIT